MTVWIKWESSVDATFRARYREVTGEAIQDGLTTPTYVGSSRMTPEHQAILLAEFGDCVSFHDEPVTNF